MRSGARLAFGLGLHERDVRAVGRGASSQPASCGAGAARCRPTRALGAPGRWPASRPFACWVAIWAFTQAPVALVAALRETSVLMAMLIGVVFMGERAGAGAGARPA